MPCGLQREVMKVVIMVMVVIVTMVVVEVVLVVVRWCGGEAVRW